MVAFVGLQYGKLVSYWHCRLVTITSVAPCDCTQKLLDHHSNGDTHTATFFTVKEKTEEIVLLFEHDVISPRHTPMLIHRAVYKDLLPNIYTATVFQPPRL
jgi:hypothetical protein